MCTRLVNIHTCWNNENGAPTWIGKHCVCPLYSCPVHALNGGYWENSVVKTENISSANEMTSECFTFYMRYLMHQLQEVTLALQWSRSVRQGTDDIRMDHVIASLQSNNTSPPTPPPVCSGVPLKGLEGQLWGTKSLQIVSKQHIGPY